MVLAQGNTSDTGDTFAPTKPGAAVQSQPNGPPSELDNGATSDALRDTGDAGTAPSAGFSRNSSAGQGLSTAPLSGSDTGSSFGGRSITSQSLSESPPPH